MANTNTKIEWTDATWSPVTGCTKVSTGCKHCYAERLWPRLAAPGQPYEGRAFTDVQCHPDRLEQPLRWKRPRMVFVNSISDLFHEDVPDEFIDNVFMVMREVPEHTFQILTKRPKRMRDYMSVRKWPRAVTMEMKPPRNVWLGVSAEDQETADERIPLLLQTPAAVRFVSLEPLLGPIQFNRYTLIERPCLVCKIEDSLGEKRGTNSHPINCGWRIDNDLGGSGISWAIVGGESGPKARPMQTEWARSIRDECQAAGVPFFFKQGSQATWADFKNYDHFPADLQVREYPKIGLPIKMRDNNEGV